MNEARVGIVVIGRNLGMLLSETLRAACALALPVVYVDSGSSDDSLARARALGVSIVALDSRLPFTAARARNAGAAFLLRQLPAPEFIQFVDGDCLLAPDFIRGALDRMDADPRIAIVAGQRRERFPDATVYNRLAALEWESPAGEVLYCGGDALVRVVALSAVHGYDARLIAGEEPELCVRLRRAGWKIWGSTADMTYHDGRMTRFGQWWRRSIRTGHAYAEGAWLHGRAPERHWVRESTSIWFWGLGVWFTAIGLARFSRGASLGLLAGYPLLGARIYTRARRRTDWRERDARLYALFCVLGKFPQWLGQVLFLGHRLVRRPTVLIESQR